MSPVIFRPERTLLAVVLVTFVSALPLAFSSTWLLPVLAVPLGALVWVLRARVEADVRRIVVCNGLRLRRVAWDDVQGFEVPRRGPVRLLRTGAKPLPLTVVTRRDLPRLMAVSTTS